MPVQKQFDSYTMLAAGATKTFDVAEKYELYQLIPDGGAITLLANLTINPTGTPKEGMKYTFEYGGSVTVAGFAVTIFSKVLTDKEALAEYTITCTYMSGSWEVKMLLSSNNGANPAVDGATLQSGTVPSTAIDSTGLGLSDLVVATAQGYMIRAGVGGVWEEVLANATAQIMVGDGTDLVSVLMSGDVNMSATGAMTIQPGVVSTSMLAFDISNNLLTEEVTILTADVLTLNGTPIEVVAAPGSGFAIEVISASVGYSTYGGAAYAANTTLTLITDTATFPQLGNPSLLISTVNAKKYTNFIDIGYGSFISAAGAADTILIENKALMVSVDNGNPTTGNSDINVKIAYRLIAI